MALSESQQARNILGAKVRGRCDQATIERARNALDYAKASKAVASWRTLTLIQRIRLARDLLADEPGDVAS